MPNPNEITLNIVVNGQPFVVKANQEQPLHVVIEQALKQSGNSGQPVANWQLRDGAGNVLDPARKVEDFHFPPGVTLFLNLIAGVGGGR